MGLIDGTRRDGAGEEGSMEEEKSGLLEVENQLNAAVRAVALSARRNPCTSWLLVPPTPRAPTPSLAALTLRGLNFGAKSTATATATASSTPRYCVFLPWVYRPNAATTAPGLALGCQWAASGLRSEAPCGSQPLYL